MNFFICGFTGSGKSTLLNKLKGSKELSKYTFIDLDDYINQLHQEYSTLAELIDDKGFDEFRKIERDSIRELGAKTHCIVALGGGAVNDLTVDDLSNWQGIWLYEEFEVCYSRIKDDDMRPISKKSENDLRELYLEREKYFKSYKKLTSYSQVLEFIRDKSAIIT